MAMTLGAQPPAPLARVEGLAYDSLSRRPLRYAFVSVAYDGRLDRNGAAQLTNVGDVATSEGLPVPIQGLLQQCIQPE